MSSPPHLQIPTRSLPRSQTRDSLDTSSSDRSEPKKRFFPLCNRSDCSDTNPGSPWSRKLILSLDGGGVRGYSSLLILKRLFYLIQQIETGCRQGYVVSGSDVGSDEPDLEFYNEGHGCSDHYPWSKGDEYSKFPVGNKVADEETDEDVEKSVNETFGSGETVKSYKPCHYFDYIAGTSTGGLTAIMLARMRQDIDKAIANYDVVGDGVFARPRRLNKAVRYLDAVRPKYRSRDMEGALRKVVKEGLKDELRWTNLTEREVVFESDPARCRTIAVAHGPVHKDNVVCHDYIFRTYEHPRPSPFSKPIHHSRHLNPGTAHRDPIWKIGRATSAAPPYFSPILFGDRKFRDGGLVANNPAQLAYSEVLQMHPQRPKLLISIGTGLPVPMKKEGSVLRTSYIKNNIETLALLPKLLTQSEKTHRDLSGMVEIMDPPNRVAYIRFNADMESKKMGLDEWKITKEGNQTLSELRRLTMNYLKNADTHSDLLKCARMLVMIRRQRMITERWESFATDHLYYCPEPKCENIARAFKTREALRNHAYDTHGFIYDTLARDGDTAFYVCTWDQCQHGKAHLFKHRNGYLEHLKDIHSIESNAVFENREQLENWLDRGRKTEEDAFNFVKDFKARTRRMGHLPSPNRKKGVDVEGATPVTQSDSASGRT